MINAAKDDVQFFADLTKAAIESARVYPEQETVGMHEGRKIPVKNILGFTAIRPRGSEGVSSHLDPRFYDGLLQRLCFHGRRSRPSAFDRLATEW